MGLKACDTENEVFADRQPERSVITLTSASRLRANRLARRSIDRPRHGFRNMSELQDHPRSSQQQLTPATCIPLSKRPEVGAKYIGNSWGGVPRMVGQSDLRPARSRDLCSRGRRRRRRPLGGGPVQPCTFTYVVCVGGTHLVRDSHNKRRWHETVWNDWAFDQCGSREFTVRRNRKCLQQEDR